MRQVMSECLVGDGHAVETAPNGRQALERFVNAVDAMPQGGTLRIATTADRDVLAMAVEPGD